MKMEYDNSRMENESLKNNHEIATGLSIERSEENIDSLEAKKAAEFFDIIKEGYNPDDLNQESGMSAENFEKMSTRIDNSSEQFQDLFSTEQEGVKPEKQL